MTDKEQIIIDETECKDYDNGCCKGSCCLNSVSIVNSCEPQNTRCDFYVNKLEEQLALKTQECEELKSESFTREELISLQEKDIDRYRKALEEIEAIVKDFNDNRLCFYDDINDCQNCDMNTDCNYLRKFKTLDIINKAKGETNA